MNGNRGRIHRMGHGLLLIGVLLLSTSTSQARWQNLLYENFERNISTWPWSTGGGHLWHDVYTGTQRAWNVEENTVYHHTAPTYIRALWCAGWPNDRLAGTDGYPPGTSTMAFWGPFDLTNAVSASGGLYLTADVESNSLGGGDDFYITCTNEDPLGISFEDWDVLFQLGTASTFGWRSKPFDFDTVRTADVGDTISYMDSSDVYFGLYFQADDDNMVGLGAFVDDISFGYDDGFYDFENRSITLYDTADADIQFSQLYVNVPARINSRFICHEDSLSQSVVHTLFVDGVPYDSVRAQWQGSTHGSTYDLMFNRPYTATDTGTVELVVKLDYLDQQGEWSETNNADTLLVNVGPQNDPPWMTFYQPDQDGLVVHPGATTASIIYEANNTPDTEVAYISFFYDDDEDPSVASPINGALGKLIHSGVRDTVTWRLNGVNPGNYFILAIMDDYFHPTITQYSSQVEVMDVDEPTEQLPKEFSLGSLYPNPFNPTVEMNFATPRPGDVTAIWYSIDGRQVDAQHFNGLTAGQHRFSWTPHNLPSGVYLLDLKSPFGSQRAKVTYIK